jgi:SAM-dependent methyltransferase
MTEGIAGLQNLIDELMAGKKAPRILEAGCGALTHVNLPDDAYVVGIDISSDQLERNKNLDERIHGDVQSYDLPESTFDMIICWNVLEHLRRPEEALKRFARALRKGGIVVLSAPNPLSTKGILTKTTPFAFHVWFHRNVRGWKEAGTEGNPPFPTYMRMSMGPAAIRRLGESLDLSVVYERLFGYGDSRDVLGYKKTYVTVVMKMLNLILKAISLGRLQPEQSQFTMVLRKAA